MRRDSFTEHSYASIAKSTGLTKDQLIQAMPILKRDGWISRYGIGDNANFTLAKHE